MYYLSERRLKEFNHLLEDFTKAWNCVRESLENYGKKYFFLRFRCENFIILTREHEYPDITEY